MTITAWTVLSDEEKLAQAKTFSPGIAEWIDAQLAAGSSEAAILEVLRLTTALARAQNLLKGKP